MKTTVFCEHVLKLSKAVAKPHRTKRDDITLICCFRCAKLVCGPVADLVFEKAKEACQKARAMKIKRLALQLALAKDGITLTRMKRTRKTRRGKQWKKPEATQKTIEEGPIWRVTKCDSQ